MASVADLVLVVAREMGEDEGVVRRQVLDLQGAGLLPIGPKGPWHIAQVTPEHCINLPLSRMVSSQIRGASELVKTYLNLAPAGTVKRVADPASGQTAEEYRPFFAWEKVLDPTTGRAAGAIWPGETLGDALVHLVEAMMDPQRRDELRRYFVGLTVRHGTPEAVLTFRSDDHVAHAQVYREPLDLLAFMGAADPQPKGMQHTVGIGFDLFAALADLAADSKRRKTSASPPARKKAGSRNSNAGSLERAGVT